MGRNETIGGGSSEHWVDQSGAVILNDTNVPNAAVIAALRQQHPEQAALIQWSVSNQSPRRREGGLWERDRYVTPQRIFDQFDVARGAVENDDVVGGVLETLESLAFSRMTFECEDADEEDIWNQIAADIDLDSRMREMFRELYTVSQFYAAVYWGNKSYTVRGKTKKGNKRKKTYDDLRVPLGITILHPKKVIPVGNFMFGQEKLVYHADIIETRIFRQVLEGTLEDPVVQQMIMEMYVPTNDELRWLAELGAPAAIGQLFLLNPQNVFRHTATRSQFEHLAAVRLKSIFDLLDMKSQLKEMDRSHLIGATNYIMLVKKGSDAMPGTPAEINALQSSVRMAARVPIIVGDHRLSIEIITPKMDVILNQMKYDTLDARIGARLLQMFINTGHISRGDDHTKLARVVGLGIESRRHMIRRTLEKFVIRPTYMANDAFTTEADLAFHPRRISLDFDAALAAYLIDLRDRGEISRETLLAEFDYEEETEAIKRVREKEIYDSIFQTVIPFSGGAPTPPNQAPQGAKQGAADKVNATGGAPKAGGTTTPKAAGRNRGGSRTPGTSGAGGKAGGATNQGKSKEQQR